MLLAAAKDRKLVFLDQPLPPTVKDPSLVVTTKLKDGVAAIVRPVLPSDEGRIQDIFYGLSEESSRQRFFGAHRFHPDSEVRPLANVDGCHDLAFVICVGDELLGYARAVEVAPCSRAQVDFVVREGWQRRGVCTALFDALVRAARAHNVAELEAYVMTHLANAGRYVVTTVLESGVYHVVVALSKEQHRDEPAAQDDARRRSPK